MTLVVRKPEKASKELYDLIIIGGGIYGVMLALEASRRKLRSLLLEKGDFGKFTSFNSLRIIHGGFRYLQKFDLKRLRDSVGERRWFLKNFPNLVKPLPCLMPLYGKGLRHPLALWFALKLYDILSAKRNKGLNPERHIPSGMIINASQTKKIFPSLDTKGLKGGAIWYDAFVPDSQRLIMEILRWACKYGATASNYVEALDLTRVNNRAIGIAAIDHEKNTSLKFISNIVINAAGPWCRDLAERFDRDEPSLFKSMLAWNVLFKRKAISDHALAVTPKKPGGHTYFIVPWKGMLLAGTGHSPWLSDRKDPMPSEEQINIFCDDLNIAVPNLNINREEILYVFPGLQSATNKGGTYFAIREVILNHADNSGPIGLYSVSGVKFTTARLVADRTLNVIFPQKKVSKYDLRVRAKITSHFYISASAHLWLIPHSQNPRNSSLSEGVKVVVT